MSQQIEIEFKNMLTKDEFELLKNHFNKTDKDFKKQVNYYFDTKTFSLKQLNSALRIREKGEQWELTLKQPVKEGLLETNQVLTKNEALSAINNGKMTEGKVVQLLVELGIDINMIDSFGSLTTLRTEFPYKDGLLVLDNSYYLNVEDFEVEYEVDNYDVGQVNFQHLLKELQIPIRQTENKIRRFYNAKQMYLPNKE